MSVGVFAISSLYWLLRPIARSCVIFSTNLQYTLLPIYLNKPSFTHTLRDISPYITHVLRFIHHQYNTIRPYILILYTIKYVLLIIAALLHMSHYKGIAQLCNNLIFVQYILLSKVVEFAHIVYGSYLPRIKHVMDDS